MGGDLDVVEMRGMLGSADRREVFSSLLSG